MSSRVKVAVIEEFLIVRSARIFEEVAVSQTEPEAEVAEELVTPVEDVVEEPVETVEEVVEVPAEAVEEEVVEPVDAVEEEVVEPVEAVEEEVVEEPAEAVEEEVVEPAEAVEEVAAEPVETVEEEVVEPAEAVEEVAAPVAVMEEVVFPETVQAPKKPRAPAKPFDFKIVTADEITQDRYNELKNCAMQYKKVKSRVSKKFDSLNSGRTQFVKFGLAGRTLKVYFNLDLNAVEPKYHCKDQSFKKPYVQVPTLIRVKSGRAVKYAKRLIVQCAEACELKQNMKYVPQDYIAQMEELYKANLEKAATGEAAVSEDEE